MRDQGLRLDLSRGKTGTDSDLLILCDRNSWLLCPLHAIAAMLAVSGAPGRSLFSPLSIQRKKGKKPSASKHINHLLARVLEFSKSQEKMVASHLAEGAPFPKYVSHALRHGSSACLNDNIGISPAWIIDRGGWKLDLLHTIFTYILGSRKYDPKVAKALADWPDVDAKVHIPNEDSISPQWRQDFLKFADDLFELCPDLDVPLSRCLAAMLVMHYEQVFALLPSCRLVKRMTSKQSHDMLLSWSKDIQHWFLSHNSAPSPRSFDDAGTFVFI